MTSAEKDASGTWNVKLTQILQGGTRSERVLHPTHLVFATGLGDELWSIPKFPNQVLPPPVFVLRFRS